MATETKKFTVDGVLVEAAKSEGGGFYDITVVQTGKKMRCLAWVFESISEEVNESQEHNRSPQT